MFFNLLDFFSLSRYLNTLVSIERIHHGEISSPPVVGEQKRRDWKRMPAERDGLNIFEVWKEQGPVDIHLGTISFSKRMNSRSI